MEKVSISTKSFPYDLAERACKEAKENKEKRSKKRGA